MFAFATKRICRSPQRICRDAQCSPESDLCPAWRRLFTKVGRTAFSASSLFLVVEEGLVERRKIAPDPRPSPRYDGRDFRTQSTTTRRRRWDRSISAWARPPVRSSRPAMCEVAWFIALRKFVRSVMRRNAHARNHIRPSAFDSWLRGLILSPYAPLCRGHGSHQSGIDSGIDYEDRVVCGSPRSEASPSAFCSGRDSHYADREFDFDGWY